MKRSVLSLAAFLTVLAAASPAFGGTHAIVVGHNAAPDGVEGLVDLRYADDDAARWSEVLGRLGTVHLLTVLDPESQRAHPGLAARARTPTADNLAAAVAAVREAIARDAAAGEDSELYFVYSGHGAHTPEGAPFLTLQGGRLGRAELYALIGPLPARHTHVIVDACHAAAIVGSRGFFGDEAEAETVAASPLAEVVAPPNLRDFPHVGVLLSATAGQSSHEWSEIRSGVFTHEVLSALLGPADINADGRIEYSEVAAYIAAAQREVDDPRAVPTVVARPPAVDARAPLVEVQRLGPAVVGTANAFKRFSIETASGVRWADGNLAGAHRVRVALPTTAAFLSTGAGEAKIETSAADVELAALQVAPPRQTAKGVESALRRGMFATPFGPDYYRGFVDANGLIGVEWPPEEAPPSPAVGSEAPTTQTQVELRTGRTRTWTPTIALWSASVASLALGGLSAAAAVEAKKEFDATDVQREAYAAADRFERNRTFAALFFGAGLATAISGALVMPRGTRVALQWGAGGGVFVRLETNW